MAQQLSPLERFIREWHEHLANQRTIIAGQVRMQAQLRAVAPVAAVRVSAPALPAQREAQLSDGLTALSQRLGIPIERVEPEEA